MRTFTSVTLAAALCACGGKDDDTAAGDDSDTLTDTPTATDTDTDAPDTDTDAPDTDTDTTDTDTTGGTMELGFEFDGATYPLTPDAIFCQTTGAVYTFSSGALRDGTGPQGNGYAYFSGVPAPGAYTVVRFDGFSPIGAGEAAVGVMDARDSSLWFSDGTAGTLDVTDAGGGALDVVWQGAALASGGRTVVSATGYLRCTP